MLLTLYSWRRKDRLSGRWRILAWKMTEDDACRWAARESVELEKVPNSGEARNTVSGFGAVFFPAQSTEAISQHFDDLGAKPDDTHGTP